LSYFRCHILKPKCTEIDFGCGFAPYPTGGALQRSSRPSCNKGDLLLKEGEGCREGNGRRKGKQGRG